MMELLFRSGGGFVREVKRLTAFGTKTLITGGWGSVSFFFFCCTLYPGKNDTLATVGGRRRKTTVGILGNALPWLAEIGTMGHAGRGGCVLFCRWY